MKNINQYIEQTNLSPIITSEAVELLVEQAKQAQFKGICIPPYWAKKARRDIGNTDIQLVTVIGFPLGYNRTEVKIQEIKSAIRERVDEFDVVINISAVKCQAWEWIKPEIAQAAQLIHEAQGLMKVIIETAYLNDDEIRKVCKICVDAGVDFIKTSSGYAPEGAKIEQVKLIKSIIPDSVGLKASGGIRTYAQALAFIEVGADRIGTSAGLQIMAEASSIL